jgi:hypothetical protein
MSRSFNPETDLAILYSTTQGMVGLRALGQLPGVDPTPVIERLLAGDAIERLT